jgi:glycine cleavage system H protein
MQKEGARMSGDVLELLYEKFLLRVPRGLWYAGYDTWARVEGDEATVGLTDFFQTKLGDIMYVTPESETSLEQDDIFATVESSKAAADLTVPVSGQVIAFNAALDDHPELINQDPYGEGWIVCLRLTDWDADRLMLLSPEAYYKVIQGRVADALARK